MKIVVWRQAWGCEEEIEVLVDSIRVFRGDELLSNGWACISRGDWSVYITIPDTWRTTVLPNAFVIPH